MSTQPLANQGRLRQPGPYTAPALAFDLDAELRSVVERPPQQAENVVAIDDTPLARERGLDKTLADTFPCSDPLSSVPDPSLHGM